MTSSNRYDLPVRTAADVPPLAVVATPIGNLSDMTPRAREALEAARTILCEDTRQAAKLINALGIVRPGPAGLERLDAHATEGRQERVIERMLAGETFALVTDAGTPAISDPGAELVARAREAGLEVRPIPGVSAVVTLLSVAGFGAKTFVFRGFFPRKASERVREVDRARDFEDAPVSVWYESPQRIEESLQVLAEGAPAARVVVAKELTKLHEKIFSGTATQVAAEVAAEIAREGARGEWAFAAYFVSLAVRQESQAPDVAQNCDPDEAWRKALSCLWEVRASAAEAAKQVSQHFGISRKLVYEHYLKLAGKKSGEKS